MSYYEIWDTGSGNLLEDAGTEEEALAAVRGYLETDDPAYAYVLSLTRIDEGGRRLLIARGEQLAALARHEAAPAA